MDHKRHKNLRAPVLPGGLEFGLGDSGEHLRFGHFVDNGSKILIVTSLSLLSLMSVLMPLVLFVISLVFSTPLCISWTVNVSSKRPTRFRSSSLFLQGRLCHQQNASWWLFLRQCWLFHYVLLWSYSAVAMILSKNMLNKVGKAGILGSLLLWSWTRSQCCCWRRLRCSPCYRSPLIR